MGKNKERAQKLEGTLNSTEAVLNAVAEMLGMTGVICDIQHGEVPALRQRFAEAIIRVCRGEAHVELREHEGPSRHPEHSPERQEHDGAAPRRETSDYVGDGLAGGKMQTFDDLVDREIDRMKDAGLLVPPVMPAPAGPLKVIMNIRDDFKMLMTDRHNRHRGADHVVYFINPTDHDAICGVVVGKRAGDGWLISLSRWGERHDEVWVRVASDPAEPPGSFRREHHDRSWQASDLAPSTVSPSTTATRISGPDASEAAKIRHGGGAVVALEAPGAAGSFIESVSQRMEDDGRLAQARAIAHEVGADVSGLDLAAALDEAQRAISRLKGAGDVAGDDDNAGLAKGDTLAQAFEHHQAVATHLHAESSRVRAILGRVAAAMQVPQSNSYGTELLERAQRWDGFRLRLKRRIVELMRKLDVAKARISAVMTHPDGTQEPIELSPIEEAILVELCAQLAHLTSDAETAKWLAGLPAGTVSPATAIAVGTVNHPKYPFTFVRGDIATLYHHLERSLDHPRRWIHNFQLEKAIEDVSASDVASDELVRLLNLIILPIVARQQRVTAPAAE